MSGHRQPDVMTVAVSRVDGGVTILRVVVREYIPDPTDATKRMVWREYDPTPPYIDSLIAKYVNVGAPDSERQWKGGQLPVSWRIVPNDYLDEQSDKTFRNAWKDTPGHGKPDVDMPKARELHRETLRRLRANVLDALDADYMKADEANNHTAKQAIAARKQVLRDLPAHPSIEAATTPEALKQAGLEVLNG